MKRFIFLTFAAIVAMSALVSCDKDTYMMSEPQPRFFKIVDATHINFYDQHDILCEENREVEFKINPQFTQNRYGETLLQPDVDESMEHRIDLIGDEDAQLLPDKSLIVTFKYTNNIENKLRIYGVHQESTDAMGNKCSVLCLDKLVLKGKIETLEQREHPFFHKVQIDYVLAKDTIVLAEASQKIIIFEDIDDVEF